MRIAMSILLTFLCGAVSSAASEKPEPSNPHGSFKGKCAVCHTADRWKPARVSKDFDHAKQGFPLDGAHGRLECRGCHATLDFKNTGSECADCHEDVHVSEFGADCALCHSTRDFLDRGANMRRHRLTRFPLIGAHAAVDCSGCHLPAMGRMMFVNTPVDCIACHQADYQAATSPNHVSLGFPTDCEQCHSTTSWHAAGFNHDLTGFPLTGTHRSIACASCHVGSQYQGTSAECVSCHLTDFQQTTSPNHQTSGFTTDCAFCHNTNSWQGATFDHDSYFPIYSGSHRQAWSDCTDCHANPSTPSQFSCIDCHRHSDQSQVNNQHQGVSGYSYNSIACYTCHPRGTH